MFGQKKRYTQVHKQKEQGAEGCKCEDEETGDVEIKLFDAVDLHTPGEPPKPESQADKEPLLTERALELKAWRVGTGISLLVNVGLIIGLLSVLIPQEIRSHSSSSGTCISGTCLREKCSNNGIYQIDTGSCSCFTCYEGNTCNSLSASCIVDASGGDPLVFESYWLYQTSALTLQVAPTWRLSYSAPDLEAKLEQAVRELHAMTGNFEVRETDSIVFGIGSTQLISAAAYAFSYTTSGEHLVYAQGPWYQQYKMMADFYSSTLFHWWSDQPSTGIPNTTSTQHVIEYVTSPNNPDGTLREGVVPSSLRVYDHAYLWPHFTPVYFQGQRHEASSVTMFTLSKLTGHAGTRIGWAIVPNASVANAMTMYQKLSVIAPDHEALYRALNLVNYLIDTKGNIFNFAKSAMMYRWSALYDVFGPIQAYGSRPNRFSANIPDWSEAVRTGYANSLASSQGWMCDGNDNAWCASSLAYIWVRCLSSEDETYTSTLNHALVGCEGLFYDAGVVGRGGTFYGSNSSYVRFELLMREQEFELFNSKLSAFVAG